MGRCSSSKLSAEKDFDFSNNYYFEYNTNNEKYSLSNNAYTAFIIDRALTTFRKLYEKAKNGTDATQEYKENSYQREIDLATASYMIASILEGLGNVEAAIYLYNSIDPKKNNTCYKAGAEKRIQDIANNASKDNNLPWLTLQGNVSHNNYILGENSRIINNQLQLNASVPIDFNRYSVFVDAIQHAEENKLPYFLMVARTESYGKFFYHFYDMKTGLPHMMYKKAAKDMTLYVFDLSFNGFDPVKLISLNFYVKPHNEKTFYSFITTDEYIAVNDQKAFEKFKNYVQNKAKFVVLKEGEWEWNEKIYGQPQEAQLYVAQFLQNANNFSGSAAFIKDIELFKKGWVGENKTKWENSFSTIQTEQKKAPQQKPVPQKNIPAQDNGQLSNSISMLTQKLHDLSRLLAVK